MTANVTLKGSGRAQRTVCVLGQSQMRKNMGECAGN